MHPDPNAVKNLGQPGMIGVGPGATLRKKQFEGLKAKVKTMHDSLKKSAQLTKDTIDQCVAHMEKLKKDVDLYCEGHPGAKPFHDDYVNTVAGLKKLQQKFDQKKVDKEMPKIGTQLTRMVNAAYVE